MSDPRFAPAKDDRIIAWREERDRLTKLLEDARNKELRAIKEYIEVVIERDILFKAMTKIASCKSHHPGDVVDIAQQALNAEAFKFSGWSNLNAAQTKALEEVQKAIENFEKELKND